MRTQHDSKLPPMGIRGRGFVLDCLILVFSDQENVYRKIVKTAPDAFPSFLFVFPPPSSAAAELCGKRQKSAYTEKASALANVALGAQKSRMSCYEQGIRGLNG